MSKIILETERLYLREFSFEDAENLYLLDSDVEVVKYTGDDSFKSLEAAKDFLEKYEDYQKNGMGRWAVVVKEDNRFVGWCGLKKFGCGMVDLGFRFYKKEWGRGFATETGKASVNYGFEKLNLKEIVGRVHKDNLGSINVLEKLGMTFWKMDECNGVANALYFKI